MLINDEAIKRSMLKALADEETSRILVCTTSKPKSVMEVVKECDIPHTSAYRLVNELKNSGLLVIEKMELAEDGKKFALYRSAFTSITAKLDGGKIEVDAQVNKDTMSKVFRLFYSLDEGKERE
jgi:predicted transcriptional regulator